MSSKLYICIPIYSTISRIPTTLRYSPLLPVSENGRVEIITIDQSDVAFRLNPAEVSDFCKYPLANSPASGGGSITSGVGKKIAYMTGRIHKTTFMVISNMGYLASIGDFRILETEHRVISKK